MAKLTTTSYTILGLLAYRPWSAYELTKHMQNSAIRAVWPRTESRIYLEFKNLLAHKLATSKEEKKGKQKRSVYTITRKGEQALSQWLEQPEGALRIESEPLLKLLFSSNHPASAHIQMRHIREQLLEEMQVARGALALAVDRDFERVLDVQSSALLLPLLVSLLEARKNWLVEVEKRLAEEPKQESALDAARRIYMQQSAKLDGLIEELAQG